MRLFALLATILLGTPSYAMVLFVDLNDAPREYQACANAVGRENLAVVNPSTINQLNSRAGAPDVSRVGKDAVERMVTELENQGKSIDQIVISGHDGSGHFMGSNGDFYANDLREILDKHKKTKKTLVSAGLVGCYTNAKHGANTYWLAASKNIKQTVGFPVQSPTKDKVDTATMVGEYCKNGKEWADKATKEELCEIYPNFAKLVPNQLVSMCSREAVASTGYGKDMCYTNEELDARCGEFDPSDKQLEMYEKYFSASNPCAPEFANPPVDKNAVYAAGASPLRKFYTQVHLWKHCAEDFRKNRRRQNTDSAYLMPDPPQMIRLVKYDDVKANVARLNAAEFADYDQRLKDLCLDQFALGDITKLNRGEMNRRIEGAAQALRDHNAGMDPDRYSWNDEPEMYSPMEPTSATAVAEVPTEGGRSPAAVVFPEDMIEDEVPAPKPTRKVAPPKVTALPRPPVQDQGPADPVTAPTSVPRDTRPKPTVAARPPRQAPVAPTAPPVEMPEDEVEPPPNPGSPPSRPARSAPAQAAPPAAAPATTTAAPSQGAPAPMATPAQPAGRPQRAAECGRPVPPSPQICSKTNPQTGRPSNPQVVETMANMMKYTMVDLNYKMGSQKTKNYRSCLHFHLVEPDAAKNYKSRCIVGYNEASKL